ncbi:MAG: NADPH-dependent assimilatory sulfite reductase hemoprotein subunit [Verrucomicrobiales bacterium]
MARQSVEEIKDESRGLYGKIVETLLSEESHFEDAEYQLLKFHGTYQQDNRDSRKERRRQKLDKEWSFMVRTKMPSGTLTAEQYLAHDKMADTLGNATMRLTTRQGIQLHGILKGNLRDTIRAISDCGLTTWGACGDVVRNTMAPAVPVHSSAHTAALKLASEISQHFDAKTSSYSSIWLDGEKLEITNTKEDTPVDEPIYGKLYLPRKFKIGIAIPPRNDVDLFTQDIGLVLHKTDDEVLGYSIYVGGGFGMTHGIKTTYPSLAKPLFYCDKENVAEACEAIVKVQRDHGDRSDRKHARLKYLVNEKGIEWFREKVCEKISFPVEEVRKENFDTVADVLGWHEQGDGNTFLGVYVAQGRIKNDETTKNRSAFRKIIETINCPVRISPNANIYFYNINKKDHQIVNDILKDHDIEIGDNFTRTRQMAHACVAMPTCGLALAESERVFNDLLSSIDQVLHELELNKDQILVRMTGCPNGCARPYNADFAFVGRSPKKYAMYVGGSSAGNRLARLHKKSVEYDLIPEEMRELLKHFVSNRNQDEKFSEFWNRTQPQNLETDPLQFHLDNSER